MSFSARHCMVLGVSTLLVGLSISLALRFRSFRDEMSFDNEKPLLVEAHGKRRSWHFIYGGADGVLGTQDDVRSEGELRVPAGVEVKILLRSEDYIYVFSCPSLKLKQIAVPDLDFSIDFTANTEGRHDLVMDPMCGFRLPPGTLMGQIQVESKRDFKRWSRREARNQN